MLHWEQAKVNVMVQYLGTNPYTLKEVIDLRVAANGIGRPMVLLHIFYGEMNKCSGFHKFILRTTTGAILLVNSLSGFREIRPIFSEIRFPLCDGAAF